MSKLAQLQGDFQAYLREHQNKTMSSKIVDGEPMTADRKLNVYHEAYRIRLLEVLRIDFPKLEIILGEQAFTEVGLSYIDQYPSTHFSVRYFGQSFEKFLSGHKPYSDYPFMIEMVNFETALMESLDAADDAILTLQDLSQIAPEMWPSLSFSFHPSVHTRVYKWDTPLLWKDIEQDNPPRQPTELKEKESWVMWRQDIRSKYESMSPVQKILYPLIAQNDCFAQMAETLSQHFDESEVPLLLVQNLQYWIEHGLISKVKVLPN